MFRDVFFWILLVFGLLTRVVFLGFPDEVVFDEVHFGKFVTSYCCSHERFFDIHPPHGKLLIAGASYIGGYEGGFVFDHIGQSFDGVSVFALRIVPALAGALIPLLVYALLLQVGVSRIGAFVGGLFFVFDNAFIVQSRIISLDNMLVVGVLGSVSLYLASWKLNGWMRYMFCAFSGLFAGFAVGVKFTGFVGLGVVGLLIFLRLFSSKSWRDVSRIVSCGLIVLVCAFVVYVVGWAIHFSLLTEAGSGDVWGMPVGNFVTDVVEVHKKMLGANYNLEAGHSYGSAWWSWPTMSRPIFYWENGSRSLYFLGNPVVWWGSLLLGIIALVFSFMSFVFKDVRSRFQGWIFLLGYVVAFVPLMRVPRALFLYHYMTALVFFTLFGVQWLDYVLRDEDRWKWYAGIIIAVILGFVFFSPLTYGFSASSWHSMLFWFPSWR